MGKLDEQFVGGGMFGPGADYSMSPASFMVQGSTTGYSYAIRGFDRSLEQKPNQPSDEYYIHPGCAVKGVGFNNPNKEYSGKVYRILKTGSGEIYALYILTFKDSKFVSIRADENLELLLPKDESTLLNYAPASSNNLSLQDQKSLAIK